MLKGAHAIVRIEDVLKAEKMETELTELKVNISNAVLYAEPEAVYVSVADIEKIIREYGLYAKKNGLINGWRCEMDTCKIVFVGDNK